MQVITNIFMKLSTLSGLFLGVALMFLLLPSPVEAHPGNTDAYGGHTCRTNCENWGLQYGEYHYHNSKGLPQSSYPIRSTYGPNGTGYTQPWPAYTGSSYSSYSSCPANSYSSGSSCKCNYGYVVKNGSCVSGDSVCSDELGLMSRYNSLSNKCECMAGYEIGISGMCTYKSRTSSYGSYSSSYLSSLYDSYYSSSCPANSSQSLTDPDKCTCNSGYQVNKKKDKCEKIKLKSNDQICKDSFGSKSKWTGEIKDGYPTCNCKSGYEWNSKGTSCAKAKKRK